MSATKYLISVTAGIHTQQNSKPLFVGVWVFRNVYFPRLPCVWVFVEPGYKLQVAACNAPSSSFDIILAMQQASLNYFSCNQDQASMELSLQSIGCSSLSIECSEAPSSCSELVIGLQNTAKVYTCTVAERLQATVSSPMQMQMQAAQLITRRAVDYRSQLVIGLENCIKLVRCTKVVQQETDCTASGAMTLAKRDILIDNRANEFSPLYIV